MSDETLDLSNVINVTILSAVSGLSNPNINTAAHFSLETPSWDDAFKIYTNATDVGEDFGTDSNAFKIAVAFFAQQPNPLGTGGYLVIIPLLANVAIAASKTIQDLVYTAQATGPGGDDISIEYTGGAVKGSEIVSVVGNAITVQIADGSSIAAEIKEAIDSDVDAAALVSVAFVAGHETDPQDINVLTNLTGGAAAAPEHIETAIARTINAVYYFGVLLDQELSSTRLAALAAYMQTIDKICFYASSVAADYAPNGPLDLLRQAGETHTRGLYYHTGTAIDTQRMAGAYAGRALSTNFAGTNTAQTMHLKTLAGLVPDATIDQTALLAVQAAGVDVYVSIAGISGLFTSGENAFFDEVYNEFWFKFALQVAGFNFLKQTNTKIPQTETGMEALKNVYRKVCAQGARNGFVGPGSWTSDVVFGDPASLIRNIAGIGYYVFSLPITEQSQADREDRIAPLVQIAIKAQGAIHKSNVIVNVNL